MDNWEKKFKKCEKIDKYLNLAEEKNIVEQEVDEDSNCKWNCPEKLGLKTRGIGNKTKNRDNPDYNIVKVNQNTEKSYGHLKWLANIQTPVTHQE